MDTKKAALEFYESFQQKTAEIREEIQQMQVDTQTTTAASLLEQLHRLERSLNEASIFLPAYDQKTYMQTMRGLQEQLQLRQQMLKPRGKFSFKTRPKAATAATAAVNVVATTEAYAGTCKDAERRKVTSDATSQYGSTIRDRKSELFVLAPPISDPDAKAMVALDVMVDHCEDAVINLTHPRIAISALHLNNLRRCILIAKPLQGSALIENCHECTFALPCHQFRMHNSANVDCHLYISSHPIIEDCRAIRFAPLSRLPIPHWDEALKISQICTSENQYQQVDDFNWLKKQASPNWSVLQEEMPSESWSTLLALSAQDAPKEQGGVLASRIQQWVPRSESTKNCTNP